MKTWFVAAGFVVVAGAVTCGGALAETGKVLKFWNLTADAITELYVRAASQPGWSANLCLSDPDHAVDPDERLSLPGVAAGTYDVRVADKAGRRCLFHNVVLHAGKPYAFSVAEQEMKTCAEH